MHVLVKSYSLEVLDRQARGDESAGDFMDVEPEGGTLVLPMRNLLGRLRLGWLKIV